MKKRKLKLYLILIGVILVLVSVMLLWASYALLRAWNEFKETAVEVTATITDISVHRSGSGRHRHTSHTVYIEYTVDDETYDGKLGYYVSGMHPGSKVKVYYDPENPGHFETKPYVGCILMTLFGIVAILVGVFITYREINIYIFANRLIAENMYVICERWRDVLSNTSVNKVRYHQLECEYTDYNGNEYIFKSDIYHPNKIPFSPGEKVKVYVDLLQPKKYYVSFEKVQEEDTYL